MHDVGREQSQLVAYLAVADEQENVAEWRFEVEPGDMAELSRFLARRGKWLLRVAADQMPTDALRGPTHSQCEVAPLRAQLVIPDGVGNTAEWRFEAEPGAVGALAGWLTDVGEWLLAPSAEREAPPGLVGPDSEPEPDIFARVREARERDRVLIEELRASAPARRRAGAGKRNAARRNRR